MVPKPRNKDQKVLETRGNYSEDELDQPNTAEQIKRKTLVGPWKNIEEFHQVHDWIFAASADDTTRRKAIEQMRIWSLRRSNLCPAAVLATTVMLEVHLKEASLSEDSSHSSEELQTLYASAFTRFFNYMSSIMQTHNMRTMYETAQQLGLPTFVVDLRHICAHGQVLPPLEVLQTTSDFCLNWLHDYYWSTQREAMANVDASRIRHKDKTTFDENVSRLFGIYDSALECYFKGARELKTCKRHLHGKRLAQLKEFHTAKALASLIQVFDAIIQELAALVKRDIGIKDCAEIYIEALLKMKYFFVVAEKHSSPEAKIESVIEVTQSLFRMLAIQGYLEDLFVNLLEIAESSVATETRRVGASFWAMQIMKGFLVFRRCKQMYKAELDQNPNIKDCDLSSLNLNQISNQARKLIVYSGVDVKNTLIFGDSVRRPWVWVFDRGFIQDHIRTVNVNTAPVIKCLLHLVDPALAPTEVKTLERLIDARLGVLKDSTKKSSKLSEKVYTVQDLLDKLHGEEIMDVVMDENPETLDDGTQKYGIWTTVPVDDSQDWSVCPLGRMPWE